jgi:hypothetical protein
MYEGPLAGVQGNLGGGMMGVAGIGGFQGVNQAGAQGFQNLGAAGGAGGGQGAANLGVGGGIIGFGGQQGGPANRYQTGGFASAEGLNRLTYEQLRERRKEREQAKAEAKKIGNAIAEFDPTDSVATAALAETAGEQTRFTIDRKISLARQRSALLPLVNQEVTGRRVSIFNERVHGKFPLRGLKFKNTTGQNLMQGPVAVFEGGGYAGDARLPDLQAGEERLLSFAIDQAVEVKTEAKSAPERLTTVRIVKGVVERTFRLRNTMTYLIRNRSTRERILIVEDPASPDWRLVDTEKPAERSRDFYRFEWKVPAGQSLTRSVTQEKTWGGGTSLMAMDDATVGGLLRSSAASPKLREALRQLIDYKARLAAMQRELDDLGLQYRAVTADQGRVRSSLEKVPANTALQKRYLEKLDQQETQIEKLQGRIDETNAREKKERKELEQYVEKLTVE